MRHHATRTVPFLVPFLGLLAVPIAAQGFVGPTPLAAPRPSTAFAAAALGVTRIEQVGMHPDLYAGPGRFFGALTVTGLSPALGGAGGRDVVAFTYDRATDQVTLNGNAAALNTTADESSLQYAPDGSYAVFERPGLGVFQTSAGVGGVLTQPLPVFGLLGGALDPCPGRVDGQPVLFVNAGTLLARYDHDVLNAAVVGAPTPAVLPLGGGACHSAWPIHGVDGDVEALLSCQGGGGTSRWCWNGDLDPATPALVQNPTAGQWDHHGCLAGGRVYMVRSTATTSTVIEHDVLALLGDRVLCTGDQGEATVLSPIRTGNPAPDLVFVFAAILFAPPTPYPGLLGAIGIDGASMMHMGTGNVDPGSGLCLVPFVMPFTLSGQLALQAFVLSPTANTIAASSTAAFALAGGSGTRSADVIGSPVPPGNLTVLDGEPMERTFLPATNGPITQVRFAAPDDPQAPWVAGRDFAAVVRGDGTAFLDIRRLGGLVVEVTTSTDVVTKYFVKSKKFAFTGVPLAAYQIASPQLLPLQYYTTFLVRQRPGAGDNGYCVNLRNQYPGQWIPGPLGPQFIANEFASVGDLARLVDRIYTAVGSQRFSLTIASHGRPAGFQIAGNTFVEGSFVNGAMTLNAAATALLAGGVDAQGPFPGIRGKLARLGLFACMVTAPDVDGRGAAFLGEFATQLDNGDPAITSVHAWDVCSFAGAPFWGWANLGGWWQIVPYAGWLGIAGGRPATVVAR